RLARHGPGRGGRHRDRRRRRRVAAERRGLRLRGRRDSLSRLIAAPRETSIAAMLIQIATKDGACPAHEFRPAGAGPWPAVLLYIDGIGMRPALLPIAERIAQHGYYVLMPDLFYRMGTYEAPVPAKLFGDPEVRAAWWAKAMAAVNPEKTMRDTEA